MIPGTPEGRTWMAGWKLKTELVKLSVMAVLGIFARKRHRLPFSIGVIRIFREDELTESCDTCLTASFDSVFSGRVF